MMEQEITQLPAAESDNDRIWEENHQKITECIRLFLKEKGSMPSISFIASATQLNWRTVKKHLAEFSSAPAFKEEAGKYRMMVCEVLNKLSCRAIQSDMKAARLFMELMGMLKTNRTVNNFINGDTGYVEINSVKVTKDVINGLSRMEKVMIEDIISASIHNRGFGDYEGEHSDLPQTSEEAVETSSQIGEERGGAQGVQNAENLNKDYY